MEVRPDRQIPDHLVDQKKIHAGNGRQDFEGIAQDESHPVYPGIERALLPPEKGPGKIHHGHPLHESSVGLHQPPHEASVPAADLAEAAPLPEKSFLPQAIAQDGPVGPFQRQRPQIR